MTQTSTITTKAIGTALRVRMAELNVSRKTVAAKTGISYPFLCQVMIGDKEPSFRTFVKLAWALEMTSSQLMELVEKYEQQS